MSYFKTKFTTESDQKFDVDLEAESDAYEAGKRSGGGSVYSVNGKTGNVVLTAEDVGACSKEDVPKNISELVDDTNDLNPINYAKRADFALNADDANNAKNADNANMAVYAERDYVNNVIHETYATKEEMESNIQFIDEEFARKHSVPTKLSDLDDDTTDKPIEKAIYAESAYDSMTSGYAIYSESSESALSANKDQKGNIIHETYSTKEEVGNIDSALEAIIAIQNQLMGVSE